VKFRSLSLLVRINNNFKTEIPKYHRQICAQAFYASQIYFHSQMASKDILAHEKEQEIEAKLPKIGCHCQMCVVFYIYSGLISRKEKPAEVDFPYETHERIFKFCGKVESAFRMRTQMMLAPRSIPTRENRAVSTRQIFLACQQSALDYNLPSSSKSVTK